MCSGSNFYTKEIVQIYRQSKIDEVLFVLHQHQAILVEIQKLLEKLVG